MTHLQEELFKLQDTVYRNFHSSLMPGVDKEAVIGVRTPVLRAFAKKFSKTEEAEQFMTELPHKYYEENNLHMMLIAQIKDYDKCISETEKFLPHIDNWATCDSPLPKCFDKNKEDVLERAKNWIATDATYVKRFGMGVMMRLSLIHPVYASSAVFLKFCFSNHSFSSSFSGMSIRSILKITGRVPSLQQAIIILSSFVHLRIIEPPCNAA